MDVVITYESGAGQRMLAEAVAEGLDRPGGGSVVVLPLGALDVDVVAAADLLVVGGGTVATAGADSPVAAGVGASRVGDGAARPGSPDTRLGDLPVLGPGLRRWFLGLPRTHGRLAAAFSLEPSPGSVGRPAGGGPSAAGVIARQLGRHGYRVLSAEGFPAALGGEVAPDERDRAVRWAADLVHQCASARPG